jgi:hypothetical protein
MTEYDDELQHALKILDATCDKHEVQHHKHETWHYYGYMWRIEVTYTHKGWKITDHSRQGNTSAFYIENPVVVDTPWEMLEEIGKHPKVLAKLAKPMEAK